MQQRLIEDLLAEYRGNVPGASLLVLKNGKPVVQCGYGCSDLERLINVSPATNFRLASISKQFTAAAILLLVQDGKLTLADSIITWLPSLPAELNSVTLLHLLTHTSGLLDYEDLMESSYEGQISDAGVLAILESHNRLYFTPGASYRYSNSAYCLLALVIERASNLSFPQFLHSRIFEPLEMHNTLAYVATNGPQPTNRAFGYSCLDSETHDQQTNPQTKISNSASNSSESPSPRQEANQFKQDKANRAWTRTDQSSTSATLGDGGIYSNTEDLAKWLHSLSTDRLLTDAARSLAFQPHAEVTGEPYKASYGLGWRLTGETTWHSGESIGFRNVLLRWPGRGLAVVLLTNRNEPEPYQLALRIAQLFLD